MTKKCSECGTESADNAKFCGGCGRPLPARAEPASTRLTDVVREWLKYEEWEERPAVDAEKQTSSTEFIFNVGEFPLKCYFEVAEIPQMFKLFMYYLDSKIPEKRMDEVKNLVYVTNNNLIIGQVNLLEENRFVRYYDAIAVENAAFESAHITNMFLHGTSCMSSFLPAFLAVCFGGKTATQALEDDDE